MEGNALTKAVWDFLEMTYRKGLLDQFLDANKAKVQDPNRPDMDDAMNFLEEVLREKDFKPLDMWGENLTFILKSFTKDDVIDALKMLLAFSKPPQETQSKEGILT
jgi:hypothetical protein